jgi:hypothetical protein
MLSHYCYSSFSRSVSNVSATAIRHTHIYQISPNAGVFFLRPGQQNTLCNNMYPRVTHYPTMLERRILRSAVLLFRLGVQHIAPFDFLDLLLILFALEFEVVHVSFGE